MRVAVSIGLRVAVSIGVRVAVSSAHHSAYVGRFGWLCALPSGLCMWCSMSGVMLQLLARAIRPSPAAAAAPAPSMCSMATSSELLNEQRCFAAGRHSGEAEEATASLLCGSEQLSLLSRRTMSTGGLGVWGCMLILRRGRHSLLAPEDGWDRQSTRT